ncbi:MAG: ZIP family metal transporter [Actinobacteria bacterium]|nr:MAG: ZIP family metal transporter [Actinomycetota bacterium]
MEVWVASLISVIFVSVLSLVGILTFALKEKALNNILTLLVSFAAGAMLGDAFFHLLPQTVEKNGGSLTIAASIYVLCGILLFFIFEKLILWRHCHFYEGEEHCHIHAPASFATMNLIGDSLHNFLDGLIIGGSYAVNFGLGVTTTMAVVFHEIPQEVGDFGVLLAGGYSKLKALLLNFATALTAILGTVIALILAAKMAAFTSFLVPFTAGCFIYIAASDLIPHLHKQEIKVSNTMGEFVFFIFGIALMISLLYFE